ncbi:MAG TPA: S9 family peptidase, partial [Candidatus Babeliaceae bacterium]|nr:S9 family peptidase [Candidatus Babeliaceae bacterium]
QDRSEIIGVNEPFNKKLDILNGLINGEITIVDSSCDNGIVISVVRDTMPKRYYAISFKPLEVKLLWSSNPALENYTLASKESFSLTNRDGLILEGYITYPVGMPRKDLPMVLKVHGGPRSRDLWSYEPIVQWIANRGYACVQVNFRGSRGYGRAFMHAGDQQWGNKMQNDLIDTVNYFIAQGVADPKRIAIFGASYGGYAALCGAAFTPDLFCCAIDICGPSNLITHAKTMHASIESIHEMIGNPDTQASMLRKYSPLFYVDRIKIPILMAHGAMDQKVIKEESEQMVKALKRNRMTYEYLLFESEGHGLLQHQNLVRFFTHADSFLERYL